MNGASRSKPLTQPGAPGPRTPRRPSWVGSGLSINGAALRAAPIRVHEQSTDDDLGMRWAIAWYRGVQSHAGGVDHVAA